jgi:hypothetical protein
LFGVTEIEPVPPPCEGIAGPFGDGDFTCK